MTPGSKDSGLPQAGATRRPVRIVAMSALAVLLAVNLYEPPPSDPDAPGFVNDGAPAGDRFHRLVRFPGKTPVPCPPQTARSAVVLAAGQSNIANYGEKPAVTAYPDRVVNFFNGRCFGARSPLLGADGARGDWLTLLGDEMIRSGRYDSVTIVPAAIGGVPIRRFSDGDLGEMLDDVVARLAVAQRRVTHVIWHQGESDFNEGTSADAYRASLLKIATRLRAQGVSAPIHLSVATYCFKMNASWKAANPVATALRDLPDGEAGLRRGVDTDSFGRDARYDDCHLSERGMADLAKAYARLLQD